MHKKDVNNLSELTAIKGGTIDHEDHQHTNHTPLKIMMSTTTVTGIKPLRNEGLRTMLIKNDLKVARKFTWDRVTDIFEEAIRGYMF